MSKKNKKAQRDARVVQYAQAHPDKTYAQIAEELGIGFSTVTKILYTGIAEKLGIEREDSTERDTNPKPRD